MLLELDKIHNDDNCHDMMTKELSEVKFETLCVSSVCRLPPHSYGGYVGYSDVEKDPKYFIPFVSHLY